MLVWRQVEEVLGPCGPITSALFTRPSLAAPGLAPSGLQWALKVCFPKQSGCWGVPGTSTLKSLVCCLCAFCPGDFPKKAGHLTTSPPPSHTSVAVGRQAKWLWEIAPKASYHWAVLFCFVVSICRCPRTKASATAQLHDEVAWPAARVLRQVVGLWRLLHAMGR